MKKPMHQSWDVVVIGGGPAGMMAAGRAAECGASVMLLEKNSRLGEKLLMSGGGRCNLTNAEPDQHNLLAKYKEAAKFLYSPFSKFGVEETLRFFHDRNMPTKVEPGNRVFPVSDSSQSVFDVLERYMTEGGVTVRNGSVVVGIQASNGLMEGVQLSDGTLILGKRYILATGGKSHPETGSTGDGFRWLRAIGHTIIDPDPSLVPIRVKESWIKELSGISFEDAKLSIFQNGGKQGGGRGKLLFTHFGLSGPLVLNMSKDIGESLKYGETEVSVDFFPTLDVKKIDEKIQGIFSEHLNKQIKNVLREIVVPLLVPVLIRLSGIDPEKEVNSITKEERLALVKLLKDFRLQVDGLLGPEKAIVTSGGVALQEVDFKSMQSRLYPNLFLVGDILNIDRPSGGYSLQLCFTTGYVAGESATFSS
jgi:predicted Rossmann fold flavoprotein